MWPWTGCLTSCCLQYPFSKMKKIMPSWLSISWGYWQSKWVLAQRMRCSKERCWWNVKFAFASLKMSAASCSAPPLGPWKGLCSLGQGCRSASLSSLTPAGLLPVSTWWRVCGAGWDTWAGGDPGPLALLLGDRVLGVGTLWITGETVGPLTQGYCLSRSWWHWVAQ